MTFTKPLLGHIEKIRLALAIFGSRHPYYVGHLRASMSMSADDSSMSAYEHELNQQVHQCSACQDCIEDYRKWYEHEKTWAVLCKPCVRFLWRDFSKLEDVNYFSNGWKDFPKYVIEELQRTHFRNSCSAMR